MAVYAYKAIGADCSMVDGTITADTPRSARDALRVRGLMVRQMTEVERSARVSWLPWRVGGGHTMKANSFIRELATLLGAGIPLLEAIDVIAEEHKGSFRSTLQMLRDRIAGGASLAEAMKEQRGVFDELTVAMTEVGENAGTLETVLARLSDFKENSQLLKDRVGTALLYPSIVLVMALGVSILLMTFVVPKLLTGLLEAGREVPLVTRIVKSVSDVLVRQWPMLLAGLAAAILGVAMLLRVASVRRGWHRFQLRIPVVGQMIRKQAILRVALVISTLMRTGIVFVRALQISQRSVRNQVIREALERCETAVTNGQDVSIALKMTGAFPAVVVRIFSVGQQSGRLEEMLERLAGDYDRQLTTGSQRLTAALEPVLILFLVVLVGFIAFATILPMLEAANAF